MQKIALELAKRGPLSEKIMNCREAFLPEEDWIDLRKYASRGEILYKRTGIALICPLPFSNTNLQHAIVHLTDGKYEMPIVAMRTWGGIVKKIWRNYPKAVVRASLSKAPFIPGYDIIVKYLC